MRYAVAFDIAHPNGNVDPDPAKDLQRCRMQPKVSSVKREIVRVHSSGLPQMPQCGWVLAAGFTTPRRVPLPTPMLSSLMDRSGPTPPVPAGTGHPPNSDGAIWMRQRYRCDAQDHACAAPRF